MFAHIGACELKLLVQMHCIAKTVNLEMANVRGYYGSRSRFKGRKYRIDIEAYGSICIEATLKRVFEAFQWN